MTNQRERYKAICMRCGQIYHSPKGTSFGGLCVHNNTAAYNIDADHALRIQARYALGKQHNPDHDSTQYADPGFIPIYGWEY